MNKYKIMYIVVFSGTLMLLGSCSQENLKREPITITAYASEAKLSLDDLIGMADLIVIGDFVNFHPSRWNTPDGKLPDNATIETISRQRLSIFSDSEFHIAKYLKGDTQDPVIRIRTFGGQVGEDRMIISDEPTYETGKTYVLFLFHDTGTTSEVAPGAYYGTSSPYEVKDGKAISADDEWVLDELIAYIQNSLSQTPSQTP